jgi:LysR family transcriptional regulator, hydrogen peroxide-inducible genes activator
MHQIRYFLAVSEELNFTRAAERCHVAQPSLTRAIKLLEEELGGPLFHRERANTHLSELGRMMKPHLEEVFERTRKAKDEARDFAKLNRAGLKLGIMCTIAPHQLVELITAVQMRHPGFELHIVDAASRQLEERLKDGDLEVAIYCLPVESDDERLHRIPLFREQMMIVVSPRHRLASQAAVRAMELDGESYVNRANCEFRGYAGPIWNEHGAQCNLVYRSERDDWVLAMIAAGLGFGFMPASCATHPGVTVRPLIEPEFWREVNLVTVRGRPHSPAVGAFVREALRARWPGRGQILVQGGLRATADRT